MSTTTAPTPELTSELATYKKLFDEKYAELDELLADLPSAALQWKPFENSPWKGRSNSLGLVLAHAISSTIYLLRRAEFSMGKREWGTVDGDEGKEEFGPANHDPAHLRERARRTQALVHEMLDTVSAADLETSKPHPKQTERVFTARYDIQHAIEHLSQHIGHAQITRQLWALSSSTDEERISG
jgi:hypothetical protein